MTRAHHWLLTLGALLGALGCSERASSLGPGGLAQVAGAGGAGGIGGALGAAGVAGSAGAGGGLPADDVPVDFFKDIQPILTEHCVRCHGGVRELGLPPLNLQSRETAAFA